MTETSPAVAFGATMLAIVLVLGPGWLILTVVRVRGLLALALAPACSTAVLASGAVLAHLAGVGWSLWVVVAATLAGLVLALLVRRLTTRAPQAPAIGRADGALIAGGLLLAVVPTTVAAGSLDAYLQRWDAVFHLAALRLVDESSSASSLTLGALSYGDGHAAPYPAGWHALGSLLPGSPTAALMVGATVAAALPWVLGCGLLAAELAHARPAAGTGRPACTPVGVAGLLAGLVTASPMSLWIGWGHVPNAAALAMLPAALALGLRLARDRTGRAVGVTALAVALLGMAFTHPNAALAVAVLLLPALLDAALRAARLPTSARQRITAATPPAIAALAALGVVLVLLLSPLAAAVTGYTPGETKPLETALVEAVTGWYRLWPSAAGVVVAVLAVGGAVLGFARRQPLPAIMLLVAWLLYLDAATGGHLQVSRLWYTSPARLSVVVTSLAVPLAAAAIVAAMPRERGRRTSRALGLAAAVLMVAIAIPSVSGRTFRTANVFEAAPGNPPQFVTTGELAMIADLPTLVDGTILGSPFSGAASAYGLVGVPVVFPVAGQVWSGDQQLVMDHLDELASGNASAEVCAAVDRLEIRYLYQDVEPYQLDRGYEALDRIQPTGATLLAEADTARLLELPACRP